MTNFEKLKERERILSDAVELKEPLRVPNGIRVNAYPFQLAGINIKQAMSDYQAAIDAYIEFHRQYQPDTASGFAAQASSKVLELMGVKCMRWPGNGLPDNALPQFIEYPTLMEDEYDEYFSDPAGFAFRKWLPRMCEVWEPFSKIDYFSNMTGIYRGAMNPYFSPEVIGSMKRIIAAAEEEAVFRSYAKKCAETLTELGFPNFCGGTSNTAFDLLADGLRGTFGMMNDLIMQPEEVERCCKAFVDIHIKKSLGNFRANGCKYSWVMLHKGFDNFISDEMYGKYYWPYLKQWIMTLIENSITPLVFCEGSYTTRLKYLRDVPPGKVIYMFEEVDLREAKKQLEGIACMMGGFPTQLAMLSNPDTIREKVKEIMDICAPGGGYIFGVSASLDFCPKENVDALFEAVEQYGKY